MDYLVTFLEGVVTFISPCLLPMLPIYVAYFAGDAGAAPHERTRRTLVSAIGFVLGFGLLFTLLGAFAGSLGSLLVRHQRALDIASGAIVIALGLNYLGILKIPLLQGEVRPQTSVVPRGFASSLVFGMVFAVGWTPCVGTFLASALSLAASSGSALHGVGLLAAYSLGLGIPFVLAAVLIDQLEGAFAWTRDHYELVDRVCGVALVIVGILMATGMMGAWLRLLSA